MTHYYPMSYRKDSRKHPFPFRKSHMREKGFTSTGCCPDGCPSNERLMQSCLLTVKGVAAAECAEGNKAKRQTWVFDVADDSLNQSSQGPV